MDERGIRAIMLGIKERLIGIIIALGLGVAGYHGVSWWWRVYSAPRNLFSQTVIDLSNSIIALSLAMLVFMIFIFVAVYEGRY